MDDVGVMATMGLATDAGRHATAPTGVKTRSFAQCQGVTRSCVAGRWQAPPPAHGRRQDLRPMSAATSNGGTTAGMFSTQFEAGAFLLAARALNLAVALR